MSSMSEDSSEISDSEVDVYEANFYLKLKSGKYQIKKPSGRYTCPFCLFKKEGELCHKDLLEHATEISTSSLLAKARANHRALAKYLSIDVESEVGTSLQIMATEHDSASRQKQEDLFVWPWMGVLVNVPTELKHGKHVGRSGTTLKEELSRFNPVRVHPLWNFKGHTGNAIIEFSKNWSGFKDAMEFESYFEAKHMGKKDYSGIRGQGLEIHGWIARADDYNSEGSIGDYLKKNGDLKTVNDLTKEESHKNKKLVENLASQIEAKNKHFQELECTFNQTTVCLDKLMEENDTLHQNYNEEIKKLQRIAHDHSRRIFEENEKLREQLDSQIKELDDRCNQLDKLVCQNDMDRKELEEERMKNAKKNHSLIQASIEQKKADENVLKLVEDQKREKEAALRKILHLEAQLDAKQKLELEIEQLKGKLQVMKHMGGEEDTSIKKKVDEMSEQLQEKIEEMEHMEALNQALLIKERKSNDELQEAHKELITRLEDISSGRTTIGIKRMGKLDSRPFVSACKERFPLKEAVNKAAEFYSKWEEALADPNWHPFRIVTVDNEIREQIDENDPKLLQLKRDLGDEVYTALTTALSELKEYNSGGRYSVPELWNFKEDRKATLMEGIEYALKQWKARKRRR